MRNIRRLTALLAAVAFVLLPMASAQTQSPATAEEHASRAFEKARSNPLELRAFLERMPKGGDLHHHLDGAVYAESYIRAGAEDNLCVALAGMSFAKPQLVTRTDPPRAVCANGQVPAEQALTDDHLYGALIDSFSMRGFSPSPGVTARDHFFETFPKYLPAFWPHAGRWLDEVATRAAAQNEQYLETIVVPDFTQTAAIAQKIGWREDLASLRQDLLAAGVGADVATARAALDEAQRTRNELEHCGQTNQAAACGVQIRYQYCVLRGFPKAEVFAQTLLGFEIAAADPRVVAINFVMPEDGRISMADYNEHMRMVGFLHGLYPRVHITLHAGELAPGLVPPEGLCCHIRLAIEEAGAERIGHGVDVMYEDRPYDLLKEMAKKHVTVEINLTSNDVILGVTGKQHPFALYRQYGVPVALSTDDEGVSRIDLTHEYERAAETYALSYADLKQMARTSLEHSFLPGASLWREQDAFTRSATACASDAPGGEKPSIACSAFLKASEKAQQQWELERRFREFEASF